MKEMTLGKYIREFRKSKGYTIIQLSELSGVSNPYISQIENDKFVPSPEILEKLSKALNISHLELMAIAGYIEGAIDLQKENERLREALKQILEDEAPNCDGYETFIHATARKALAGESNAI